MFVPGDEGEVRQRYEDIDVKSLNPLVLAYIGDAYFHLFVRTRLLSYEQSKVQILHQFGAQIVSAVWQATPISKWKGMLTEGEKAHFGVVAMPRAMRRAVPA